MQESVVSRYSRICIDRLNLLVVFFLIGAVSLMQSGCSGSSNGGGNSSPSVVTTISPAAGSTTALVGSDVSVVFNVDMDKASIENGFSLSLNNNPVPGLVIYDPTTKTVTLAPVNDLNPDAEYFAAIDSNVVDADGNQVLPSGFIWSFSVSESMVLISNNGAGQLADNDSQQVTIDASGRYIAFESSANNLVSVATTINRQHIYRKDTLTGEVLLVSSDASNQVEANTASSNPDISSDGRYVVFESKATNLDSSVSSPGNSQIFLKDLQSGTVQLVSRSSSNIAHDGSEAVNPAVSDDGQIIVFETDATNLSSIASGGFKQIYRKNLVDGSVEMVSRTASNVAGDGPSTNPAMSADGVHIVFESTATNFVTPNGFKHIYYVNTVITHTVERVSVDTAGASAAADSENPSISDDGLIVAFQTIAVLESSDTGGFIDVYIRNRRLMSADTRLVSLNTTGAAGGNGNSSDAQISGDGKYVVFESLATNLVSNDNNSIKDIFVRNLLSSMTARLNIRFDGSESTFPINTAYQHLPVISQDGRYISFQSEENYIFDDTDSLSDIYRVLNSIVQ